MPDRNIASGEFDERVRQQAEMEGELAELRGALRQLDQRVQQLRRAGVHAVEEARNLEERRILQLHQGAADRLLTAAAELRELGPVLHEASPEDAIQRFSDTVPLLLFPVRMETKFRLDLDPPQLWLRIYPDEVAIETHEALLTREEFEAGAQYCRDIWPVLSEQAPQDCKEFYRSAWRRLVQTFGPERSAWILQVLKEQKFVLNAVSLSEERWFSVARRLPLLEFPYDAALQEGLDKGVVPASWPREISARGFPLSESAGVEVVQAGEQWQICDLTTWQAVHVNLEGQRFVASVPEPPRFKVTEETLLFAQGIDANAVPDLDNGDVPASWLLKFEQAGFPLSDDTSVRVVSAGEQWEITDDTISQTYHVAADGDQVAVWARAVPVKPESWSAAARSYVMPDCFVVRLYHRAQEDAADEDAVFAVTHEFSREVRGNPIPHPLHVGPAPIPLEQAPVAEAGTEGDSPPEQPQEFLDQESKWIEDFAKAKDVGMAIRIDLTDEDRQKGYFSRVVVLGVKSSLDEGQSADCLVQLIQSHQYTEGFAFVQQGTPTNNTSSAPAGYTSSADGGVDGWERVHRPTSVTPQEAWRDGPRVAAALGVSPSSLASTPRASASEDRNAQCMLQALWSSTWQIYLATMMTGVLSPDEIVPLRQHLFDFVRGRGPYPAVRVGNVPYGILPVLGLKGGSPSEGFRTMDPFGRRLGDFLLALYPRWQQMARDVDAVPRAGGSDDPDRELIEILRMEAAGRHVHVRPIITELYLWNLLRFLQPTLFNPGFPASLLSQSKFLFSRPVSPSVQANGWRTRLQTALGGDHLRTWWGRLEESMEQSRALFRELVPDSVIPDAELPQILSTIPWNPARPSKGPLVTEAPLSEEHPLEGPQTGGDAAELNYIRWLNQNELEIIRDDAQAAEQSNSLLFQLLRRSVLIEGAQPNGREWLDHLAPLPTAELERLLVESLDLSSHRLDAWITSLATRQLDQLRRQQPTGIRLGAYGWVEDLRPEERPGGGFIHAPSISHAATAAVLRSAYLTHANGENADLMAVNLTSERMRRALWLLQGIREGQELGALLGYRFERGLHDRSGVGLELDQYVSTFRQLYPLKVVERADEEEAQTEEEAVETVAARNVVDGLRLLEDRQNIPFGQYGLPWPPSPWAWASAAGAYEAIQEVLDSLEDSLDALGDLALAESVYQPVQGNYQRAGALLDTLAGSGRPPEPEVVATPRSGINLKHRVAMLFTGDELPANAWPQTPRGTAEPHLNGWAAQLLGDPAKIKCTLRFPNPATADAGGVEQSQVVSLKDLGLGPLDFLYLSQSSASGEATELEERLAYHIRRPWVHLVVQLHGSASNGPASTPVLDNTSSSPGSALQTLSWQHTVGSEDNTVLIVGVCHTGPGASVRSVTYGGQPLTSHGQLVQDSLGVELWHLPAPSAGTSHITVTLDQAQQAIAGAASFSQVDQTNPLGGDSGSSAVGNTISTHAVGAAGTVLLDIWSKVGSLGHHTAAELQIGLWEGRAASAANDDDNVQGGMSYASPGEGDYTMSWTLPFQVEFKSNDALASDDVPMANVMLLARKMLELLGHARALGPLDLQLPEEAAAPGEAEERPEESQQRAADRAPLYDLLRQRLESGDKSGAFDRLKEVRDKLADRDNIPGNELRRAVFDSSFFGLQGAVRVDLTDEEFDAQVTNVSEQLGKRHKACQEALDAADAAFDGTDLARIEQATRHLLTAFEKLFGESFTVLPPFAPLNRDELALALQEQNTTALLDGENERWPVLWLQQVARVRPEIDRFESVAMLAQALSGEDRLSLRVGQLPHGASDRWLALPFKDSLEKRQGMLSLVVHIPGQFDAGGGYAGLVLGDWDEVIPGEMETTAVAFNFNQPNTEPPQTMLIAVPPESAPGQRAWTWDALVDCVESTLDLAKVRAVDLDALKGFGRFLPALYSPIKFVEPDAPQ